jgi:hypothetical protein
MIINLSIMESNDLIKELTVQELHEIIKDDSVVHVVSTYMKRTSIDTEEYRAVYRIDGQLYDSIHLFSNKVSEIARNGFRFQKLEPNKMYKTPEGELSDVLSKAIKLAAEIQGESNQAVEAVMMLWNKIAEDYVLSPKSDNDEWEERGGTISKSEDSPNFLFDDTEEGKDIVHSHLNLIVDDQEFEKLTIVSKGDQECYRILQDKSSGDKTLMIKHLECDKCGQEYEGTNQPTKFPHSDTFTMNCTCGNILLTV